MKQFFPPGLLQYLSLETLCFKCIRLAQRVSNKEKETAFDHNCSLHLAGSSTAVLRWKKKHSPALANPLKNKTCYSVKDSYCIARIRSCMYKLMVHNSLQDLKQLKAHNPNLFVINLQM